MEIYEFRLRIHWNLFLRFELTIFQHYGLAPIRQHAIIWTNDLYFTDTYMRHLASLNERLEKHVLYICTHMYMHPVSLGYYSLSGRPSYGKILWSLEAGRFGFRLFQLLWNLTGTPAEALPICLIVKRNNHYGIIIFCKYCTFGWLLNIKYVFTYQISFFIITDDVTGGPLYVYELLHLTGLKIPALFENPHIRV